MSELPLQARQFIYNLIKKTESIKNTVLAFLLRFAKPTYPVYSSAFYSTQKYSTINLTFTLAAAAITILGIRLLGPSEFGKFALVSQLALTIGSVLSLGFSSSLEEKELVKNFSKAVGLSLIASLTIGIIYIFITGVFHGLIVDELRQVRFVFVLFIVLTAIFRIGLDMSYSLGRLKQKPLLEGILNIAGISLAVLIMIFSARKFQTVFYSNFVVLLILAAVLAYSLRKYFYLVKLNDLKPDEKFIRFCLIAFVVQMTFMIMTLVDSVLLRILLKDPVKVGYFNAGILIPKMFEVLLISVIYVPFCHYLSKQEIVEVKGKHLLFSIRMSVVISGLISLFIFSFADKIIPLIYSGAYSGSIKILKIYVFVLSFSGLGMLAVSFFQSINKPYIPVIFILAQLGMFVMFDLLFIPGFRVMGPVVTTLAVNICLSAGLFYILIQNGVTITRKLYLLFVGILLSMLIGFLTRPYMSIPFFLFFVYIERLISPEEIVKTISIIRQERSA